MDEDIKIAIEHVINIISESLKKRNERGIEMERKVRNFWNKIKKRLPEDLAKGFSENPDDKELQDAFAVNLEELMNKQNIKMNVVIFLYKQGIQLFD